MNTYMLMFIIFMVIILIVVIAFAVYYATRSQDTNNVPSGVVVVNPGATQGNYTVPSNADIIVVDKIIGQTNIDLPDPTTLKENKVFYLIRDPEGYPVYVRYLPSNTVIYPNPPLGSSYTVVNKAYVVEPTPPPQ